MTSIEKEIREGDYTVGLNGVAVIANTFAQDFVIAGMFGAREIEDTFKRCFDEWKKDIRYMTALAITCNHLGWHYHGQGLKAYADLFFGYWEKLDAYILDGEEKGDDYIYRHYDKDEVHYFIQACD